MMCTVLVSELKESSLNNFMKSAFSRMDMRYCNLIKVSVSFCSDIAKLFTINKLGELSVTSDSNGSQKIFIFRSVLTAKPMYMNSAFQMRPALSLSRPKWLVEHVGQPPGSCPAGQFRGIW